MPEPVNGESGLIRSVHEHARITYTEEFNFFIREHPGAIATVKKLMRELDRRLDSTNARVYETRFDPDHTLITEEGDVRVMHFTKEIGLPDLYKVEIAGRAFFVKREDCHFGDGYGEVLSSVKAKELLKDIPWVEVINFHLGYTDAKRGRSYFVSEWSDLPTLKKFTDQSTNEQQLFPWNTFVLMNNIDWVQKIRYLRKRLKGYFNIGRDNMFYDAARKKIILFDLSDTEPFWGE